MAPKRISFRRSMLVLLQPVRFASQGQPCRPARGRIVASHPTVMSQPLIAKANIWRRRGRVQLPQSFWCDGLQASAINGHADEAVCRRQFEIVRCQHLGRTSRWLYLLQKKQPATDA